MLAQGVFHFVTKHAFDRQTDRPWRYRALHYMQSPGAKCEN